MRQFTTQGDVCANVRELRRALGSIAKPLSRDDLARAISARHPKKPRLNGTTVQRWEEGTEPDIVSTAIMADLAGVAFEEFALGKPGATPRGSVLDLDPTRDRLVTDEELDRAERLLASKDQSKRLAQARKAGGKKK